MWCLWNDTKALELMAEKQSIIQCMLNGRVSELYGKDDKEDRDEEGVIPGIQGKITCLKSCDLILLCMAMSWSQVPSMIMMIGLFAIFYFYSVLLAVLAKKKPCLKNS